MDSSHSLPSPTSLTHSALMTTHLFSSKSSWHSLLLFFMIPCFHGFSSILLAAPSQSALLVLLFLCFPYIWCNSWFSFWIFSPLIWLTVQMILIPKAAITSQMLLISKSLSSSRSLSSPGHLYTTVWKIYPSQLSYYSICPKLFTFEALSYYCSRNLVPAILPKTMNNITIYSDTQVNKLRVNPSFSSITFNQPPNPVNFIPF